MKQQLLSDTKRTFFYMKMAATLLSAAVLGALIVQSNQQKSILSKGNRNSIPDISPVSARPPVAFDRLLLYNFADQKNEVQTLSKFDGQVLHLSFWASWCEPCLRELPIIEKLIHQLNGIDRQKRYQVLLVNLDDPQDQKKAQDIQKQLAPTTLAMFDNTKKLEVLMDVQALPFHVILDSKQRIASAFYSSIDQPAKINSFVQFITQLMVEKPAMGSSSSLHE